MKHLVILTLGMLIWFAFAAYLITLPAYAP